MFPAEYGCRPTYAAVELPADPSAAGTARRLVDHHCRAAWVDDDVRETAVLLTSEVVTNGFLHGRGGVQLLIRISDELIRVGVVDDSSRMPQLVRGDPDALNGRGLGIVDALASAWGTKPHGRGKLVWFELALASGEPASRVGRA